MKKYILIVLVISSFFVISRGSKDNSQIEENKKTTVKKDIKKQLNITFLLDLSDRIEPNKYPANPQHWERDIAIINEFVQVFKADLMKKKNFHFKGKMKVLFSPVPKDAGINEIAQKLEVNSAVMKPAEKTAMYRELEHSFTENLKSIYKKTLETKQYVERLPHRIDGRARSVRLTGGGLELVNKAVMAVEEVDLQFFKALGLQQDNFVRELQVLSNFTPE